MTRSNQRITKIKRDPIEALLKRAEAMDVADGCVIQPDGSDLAPYPDMNQLRGWMHNYLLSGISKIYTSKIVDGVTYYTGLIDGLPIITSDVKSIDVEGFADTPDRISDMLTAVGTPTLSQYFVASGFSASDYYTLPDTSVYKKVGDSYILTFTTGLDISSYQVLLSAFDFMFITIENGNLQIIDDWSQLTYATIIGLEAETTYTIRVKVLSTTQVKVGFLNSAGSFTDTLFITYPDPLILETSSGFYIGSNTSSYFKGSIDFNNCKIVESDETEKLFLHYTKSSTGFTQEYTSKPGLWLSNLIQPYNGTASGSYIRQNFIHSSESSFEDINSKVIGNYAYSFLQSLQAYRAAGSSHDDADSYSLHWSPNDLSCMSFESMIITELDVDNQCTYYNTLAVPSDPDMQSYEQTLIKDDLEFYSVDNNNSEPATTTLYSVKAPAGGYLCNLQFETEVDPNDNEPFGGCVTGTITYNDSSLGTLCTQTVNSCFQSYQSYFDPDKPDIPDSHPINEPEPSVVILDCGKIGCCTGLKIWGQEGTPITSTLYNAIITGETHTEYPAYLTDPSDDGKKKAVENFRYQEVTGACGAGGTHRQLISSGFDKQSVYCGDDYGLATVTLYPAGPIEGQTGVDIYMNIIDLKCQYEMQGLPWEYGCGTARFKVEISTEPCREICCNSFQLASNVDISVLGNIPGLRSQIINNY